jgi:AraC-like DNA-binding protein
MEVFQVQDKPQGWIELVTHRLLTDLITELIIAGDQSGMISQTTASFIEIARTFLEEHYVEEINLDRLSALLGVSKFHLAREFKKATGQAPNEYLISTRINHSKDLLKYTSYSIIEISEMVGVPNTNHYLYLFKSREGTTPSAFRKLWRSK